MSGKLRIATEKTPALTVTRQAIYDHRLVYIAKANKPFSYAQGKSRIAYIGTTRNGLRRITESAAWQAPYLLDDHGFNELEYYIVTCTARRALKSWKKLEDALLIRFRERFGEVPCCNTHGKKYRWDDELDYFTLESLNRVIAEYS